jgi:DNA-binding NarL/FixJ family response regulator
VSLRVVVAQSAVVRSRAMSKRLTALGYDVVAQVTTIREAVDAVSTTEADAVLFDVHLSDGAGVHGAISATRARAGTAALVLSSHPALADRAARPNWGPVALISADTVDAELDADVQEIVATARAMAEPEFAEPVYDETVDAVDAVDAVEGVDTVDEVADKDIPFVDIAVESTDAIEPEGEPREVVVERAVAQIVARTRLTPADALKLMEEEADEDGRDILEIATAILAEADAAA